MNTTHYMTGAELQTLRESLHLERADLADLTNVEARTVKHWENGRAGVPADVASLLQSLAEAVATGTAALLQSAQIYSAIQAKPAPLALVRFRAEDYPTRMRKWHQACGLDAEAVATIERPNLAVHEAVLSNTFQALHQAGKAPRIVWFDAENWHAWRTNNPTAPAWAWAQEQITQQAKPHRGDQPPAAA